MTIGRKSFNPRPSSLRGATSRVRRPRAAIRFQSSPLIAEGRYSSVLEIPSIECFNPRPSSLRGATLRSEFDIVREGQFQSSPLIAEGRYDTPASLKLHKRFNPRPSSLRGATAVYQGIG